jgi:hypothetical protein
MKTIKQYKGVALKYNENDGMIYFNFEKQDRKVRYVFEAEQIIDEPIWEPCNMVGYFQDGYIDRYIGEAKAEKLNIKTGEPFWLIKEKYDHQYKPAGTTTIYPKTPYNDKVCQAWKIQKEVYDRELYKLNNIVRLLQEEE